MFTTNNSFNFHFKVKCKLKDMSMIQTYIIYIFYKNL